jgi:hypothetical protein
LPVEVCDYSYRRAEDHQVNERSSKVGRERQEQMMDKETKEALVSAAKAAENVSEVFNKLAGPLANEKNVSGRQH